MTDKRPFLNLSDVPEGELDEILLGLAHRRTTSGLKRVFGRRYIELRRRTEMLLRDYFIRAGGKPERSAPHYFVLGSSQWYRGLSPETSEVAISLSDLPSPATSFTYPDSFTAMGTWPPIRPEGWQRPYHDQVFRLEQLIEVVNEYGLPVDEADEEYEGYQNRPFEKYIEVQLWSDDPIQNVLAASQTAT